MVCKKCGREISDNAVFCNYCGEPVNAKRDTEEAAQKNAETLTDISLEMRRLSDKMIASYVAYVKKTELAYKQLEAEHSAKIAELNVIIEKKEKALENANNQISVLNYNVDEINQDYLAVKEENNNLKAENNELKTRSDEASDTYEQPEESAVPVKDPVTPPITEKMKTCYNCGAQLEADANYCNICGKWQGGEQI